MSEEQLSLLEPLSGARRPMTAAKVAAMESRWLAKYEEWHALSIKLHEARKELALAPSAHGFLCQTEQSLNFGKMT
jgi:hypothetical protein